VAKARAFGATGSARASFAVGERHRSGWARFACLVAAAFALVLASGCNRKVSAPECKEMLEKYLDMVIGGDPELAKLTEEQRKAVREVKKAVRMGEPAFAQVSTKCETEVTRKEYDCAMHAPSPDAWQACIE
jgi:hypothetical protein